ncbi:plastocyanin/azurin family copper-binding protein [Streptomyces sp. NPDC006739]|uniref:cupredoxin domain-containing protein n=1 Tax=Streptomyces sp. NPDC006739 TaxID=3364763 RepID=UPI003674377A
MPRLTVPRTLLAALVLAGAVTVLPAPAPPTAEAATAHQVLMSGYAFSPRVLTVTAGDTVTWTNQDQAPHDVETTSGPAPVHSPMLSRGGSWSHTFTTPGSYGYVCTVHPGMTARLVVRAAVVAAPAAPRTAHPTAHEPAAAASTRSAGPAAPSAHTDHNGRAAAPAGPSASDPPVSTTAAVQAATQTQSASSATRPLDPLLLLAGVVAGVAVLCLLLVGSRSAAGRPHT